MTFSDELPPEERLEDEGVDYPEAFGITFTPLVSGIVFGVAGLIAAIYLWFQLAQPKQQEYNDLVSEKDQLENQIEDQPNLRDRLDELEGEINQVRSQQNQVLALLSSRESLDVLLFDLEQTIERTATQIGSVEVAGENSEFQLESFNPQTTTPQVVEDGSFGSAVDGKIQRKTYSLEVTGTYSQTQQLLRNLEQLQPLLLVNDFSTQLTEEPQGRFSPEENRIVATTTPQLQSTFQLEAILPVDPEVLREMEQAEEDEEDEEEEEE
ncbi:MAG: pilus assembly protein PilO [Halothece sp.]